MGGETLKATVMLWSIIAVTGMLAGFGRPATAAADDACTTAGIRAAADVTVSDGLRYRVETWFRTPREAAIRFHRDPESTIAVEGGLAWSSNESGARLAPDSARAFVLGHQYHAFIRDFAGMVENPEPVEAVAFAGMRLSGTSGKLPLGETVYLLQATDGERPAGLRLDIPGREPIEAEFLDWRRREEQELPFRILIDDGEREFEYRYTSLDLKEDSPLWFHRAVPAPEIDAIEVQRLHRRLLVAHCLGDADMMAENTSDGALMVERGSVTATTSNDIRARFASVFERLDYTAYLDLQAPRVTVAESRDMAWLVASVRAECGRGRAGRRLERPGRDRARVRGECVPASVRPARLT